MVEYLKEALEIIKAQASVRAMTEDELTSMLLKLTRDIQSISGAMPDEEPVEKAEGIDPAKAIKEKTIVCVECGKTFKLLTKKHLATHGISPEEYRERYGYKKNAPLVCKALQRERRKKMKDMKLWERRRSQS